MPGGTSEIEASGSTIDELLRVVALGDAAAFADLHRCTEPRLLRRVRATLIDTALSEEIVQEVYLEIWSTARSFDRSRGSGIAWMLTIARRRAIDRVRAVQASRDRDHRAARRDLIEQADPVGDHVQLAFESAWVRSALSTLSAGQREIIELVYLDGCSQAEAARRCGITASAARSRTRGGLRRLRTAYAA